MALPIIGSQIGQQQSQSPAFFKRKGFANDSKNMDQILNNNISKDYPQLEEYLKKTTNRPQQLNPSYNAIKSQNISLKPDYQQQQLTARSLNGYEKNLYELSTERNDLGKDYRSYNEEVKPNVPERRVQSYDRYNDNQNEDKTATLEKTYNHLQEQVKNLEKQLYNETRRYRSSFDNEREIMSRLESKFRFQEDNLNSLNAELTNKLAILESRLHKEERSKQDLREKLFATEQSQKELMAWFKGLQSTESSELLQMRELIHQKLTEDQTATTKEREKTKALFNEVVRLGEQLERNSELYQASTLNLEARLQSMEAKYQASERALNSFTQKGETGIVQLNDWNEKIDKKLSTLEATFYQLGKEQQRDRDTIIRLEAINSKITDDVTKLLSNLHNDYTGRLDVKVTELVNRIVMEHEERIKTHVNDTLGDIFEFKTVRIG